MRLPFGSLRNNLIAAFAAVIALSLLLASGAFAYLLRDYQTEREKDRLAVFAFDISRLVLRQLNAGQPLGTVEARLDQEASAAGVRLVLVNESGLVIHDTDQGLLTGRQFPIPAAAGRRPGVFQGPLALGGERLYFTVVPYLPDSAGPRVAVVAPEWSVTNAWRDLLPRLSSAAVGALLVSIAIAWWLASSITRPLRQITRASEEIARGNYDDHLSLPATGDEVGRLAEAFTVMAREVARSQRAMRDLLANVSHDLRTPLTSIQGFAGALVDGTLAGADGAREAGRVIGEEAERMRRLVEDLLYLGRIESGELALERQPLDLAEVARAAQPRFAFRAEEAGVEFRVEAPGPLPILGDRHRLAQVLDNLLENALKHTPRGGAITASALRQASPAPAARHGGPGAPGAPPQRPVAVLAVHNSGSFIPPAEADRVFERFYQLDKARAGRGGRGLGLAIAHEIVQAHEGSLAVESSPARGTTFTARFRLAIEQPDGAPLSSGAKAGRGATAPVPASARH